MRFFSGASFLVLVAVVACATQGCGRRPARVHVAGHVLIDGQPLTHGYIRFVSQNERPSGSEIGKDGSYVLSCYEPGDGAVPGTHQVEIDSSQFLSGSSFRWHAPKKYASFRTSGIVKEITQREDDLLVELTWEGGAPFVEGAQGELEDRRRSR